MILSKEEAIKVVTWDHKDWKRVPDTENIVDQRRWATVNEAVFRHIPTDKFYLFVWETGSTEYQDNEFFCGRTYSPEEVVQVEKLVKVWEVKKE